MMWQIKTYAPCQDRNGWKTQKFHELLHVIWDIENYGGPNNDNTAPNEKNLKRMFLFPKSVNIYKKVIWSVKLMLLWCELLKTIIALKNMKMTRCDRGAWWWRFCWRRLWWYWIKTYWQTIVYYEFGSIA